MDGVQAQGGIAGIQTRPEQTLIRGYPGLTQKVAVFPFGELIWNELQPGAQLPQHSHPELQFGFALAGHDSFELLVGDEPFPLEVGSGLAYSLGSDVRHGAAYRGVGPIYTVDVKVRLRPEGRDAMSSGLIVCVPDARETSWGTLFSYRTPFGMCEYAVIHPGMSMAAGGHEATYDHVYRMYLDTWSACGITRLTGNLPLPRAGERPLHVVTLRLSMEAENGVEPSVYTR